MALAINSFANLGDSEEKEKQGQLVKSIEYNVPQDSRCKVLVFDYPAGTMCSMLLDGKVAAEIWYRDDGLYVDSDFMRREINKYSDRWHYVEPMWENHISIASDDGNFWASRGDMIPMKITNCFVILNKSWIDYIKSKRDTQL